MYRIDSDQKRKGNKILIKIDQEMQYHEQYQ